MDISDETVGLCKDLSCTVYAFNICGAKKHVQAATWILSMVILNYSYMKNHLQFSVSTVL